MRSCCCCTPGSYAGLGAAMSTSAALAGRDLQQEAQGPGSGAGRLASSARPSAKETVDAETGSEPLRVCMQYLTSIGDTGEEEDDFLANVEKNTRRYQKIFAQAADDSQPAPTDPSLPSDIFDVLATQALTPSGSCCLALQLLLAHACAPAQRANLSQRRREEASQEGEPQVGPAPGCTQPRGWPPAAC